MRWLRARRRATAARGALLLLVLLAGTLLPLIPTASAAEVIVRQPGVLLIDRDHDDRQVGIQVDHLGRRHLTWVRDGADVMVAILDHRGDILLPPVSIDDAPGGHPATPTTQLDEDGLLHIVWADLAVPQAIRYTLIDPAAAPLDGTFTLSDDMTRIADTPIATGNGTRSDPHMVVDARGGVHVAWTDTRDELDVLFGQPQIRYALHQAFPIQNRLDALIVSTLVTTAPGPKGHARLALDADETVQIAWEGVRGGRLELVFMVDTSGSMNSEWGDMCQVIHGGQLSGGGSTPGLVSLLGKANLTVYETVYTMGYQYPLATVQGECAGHVEDGLPRETHLTDDDPSGGIRAHRWMLHLGEAVDSDVESWGPGSNWACRSWTDADGVTPGDPPTPIDHLWNHNATPIVVVVSDERPYLGDRGQGVDDLIAVAEAHDACVEAGVLPIGLYGQVAGGAAPVISHMKEFTQCPMGTINTDDRSCPGLNTRTSNAGGIVMEFPNGGDGDLEELRDELVAVSTGRTRDIYVSVLARRTPAGSSWNSPMEGTETLRSCVTNWWR